MMFEYSDSDISADDFDPSDFDNPIKLLEALKKRIKDSTHKAEPTNIDTEKISEFLTVAQVESKYNIPESIIMNAVKNGKLAADKVILLFSETSIKKFLAVQATDNALYDAFIKEIRKMKLTCSYKPLLLLALLECRNVNGELNLSEVLNYYFSYYKKREANSEIIEKPNSPFVKYPYDRTNAKKTIVRYPVKIFQDKGFLEYNKEENIVKIKPNLWSMISTEVKADIISECYKKLDKYYDTLKKPKI